MLDGPGGNTPQITKTGGKKPCPTRRALHSKIVRCPPSSRAPATASHERSVAEGMARQSQPLARMRSSGPAAGDVWLGESGGRATPPEWPWWFAWGRAVPPRLVEWSPRLFRTPTSI